MKYIEWIDNNNNKYENTKEHEFNGELFFTLEQQVPFVTQQIFIATFNYD